MRFIKFLGLWVILALTFTLINNSFEKSAILIQVINATLYSIGYIFSYNFLIKPFLYKGRFSKFIALHILVIASLSLISMLSTYEIYVFEKQVFYVNNYWNEPVFMMSNFMTMFLVVSSLLSIRFVRDKMKTQSLLESLEKEKVNAELGFLKAQINPHFLFNSLNNILFQIDKSNKDARETLLKFSEMLRYQLYECSIDLIEIEKEIKYIRNYIEIQMLRKTEKYDCHISISESVKNFRIAPLLLIPFIENAFKYVSNHSSRKNNILISMDYKAGEFIFTVLNDKDNISATTVNENKGIGLANVKRRLALLYGKKHSLEIANLEDKFTVLMKIKIS